MLHDSAGTGTGSIDWNFAIADKDLDYLAANETLTLNYNVKVSDASTSSTQTVSLVITGANDAPVITSNPEAGSLSELSGVTGSNAIDTTSPVPTGTLNFTDVDLSDVHTVSVALDSAVWSSTLDVPNQTMADLQTALATALHDSTGTGLGGIDWTFKIPDRDLDFLSASETLTVQYDVAVTDGATSATQTVTVTIHGASDPLTVTPLTVDVSDTTTNDTGSALAAGSITDFIGLVDLTSPHTIIAVNGSGANVGVAVAGAYGSLVMGSDGSYAYLAGAAVDPLQIGDHVSDQFSVTVEDGMGQEATTTLTFNIAGADDPPLITGGKRNRIGDRGRRPVDNRQR